MPVHFISGLVTPIMSAWAPGCYVTYLSVKALCILGTLFAGEQGNFMEFILLLSYPIPAWCLVDQKRGGFKGLC